MMDLMDAIRARHSVRKFKNVDIEPGIVAQLRNEMFKCNDESGLNIQLQVNEPKAFDCFLAHYGHFENVKNYFCMVGPDKKTLDEAIGYYGEYLVIKAQQLGVNSCWVGMSYSKSKSVYELRDDEKLVCMIALGRGVDQGTPHKSKDIAKVTKVNGEMPEWFKNGVESALLAPTAINQQKFMLELVGDYKVKAYTTGIGFYKKVDLGIVKYHFEMGAGSPIEWIRD